MLAMLVVLVFAGTFLVAAIAVFVAWLVQSRRVSDPAGEQVVESAFDETPFLLRQQPLTTLPLWRQVLDRLDFGLFLKQRIDEADMTWSVGRVSITMLLLASLFFAVFLDVSWAPPGASLVAAWIGGSIPYWIIKRKRKRRLLKIEAQFPDALDSLARAMRAGHALSGAVMLLAAETPAPLGPEFRKLADEHRLGLAWGNAFENFSRRLPILEIRMFVAAIMVQTRTGGKLTDVLEKLSETIRESAALRGEVRSHLRARTHDRDRSHHSSPLHSPGDVRHKPNLHRDSMDRSAGKPADLGRRDLSGPRPFCHSTHREHQGATMTTLLLLSAFFLVVMGSVTAAGYFYSRSQAAGAGPSSGTLLKNTLLRVGEAVPGKRVQAERCQKKLIAAGYRHPNSPQIFAGVKMAVTLILGITFAAIRLFSDGDYFTALIAMGAGAGIGYMLPDRFLEYAVRARSKRLLMGIPAAIDLLVLSLEAGQNLDSALVDTARELNAEYPDLSAEFNLVQMELLASLSRPEVFRSLRDRNQEPELKRLAQVFIDSDRFGTSLAPALRSHVKYLRIRLRQQAYEQARKVSVKLVFPVFFLIFPSVILVTLGPAVLQIFTRLAALTK